MPADNRNSERTQAGYAGWRGNILARLALSRIPKLTVIENPVNGKFDLLVMTEEGLSFLVEVRAISTIHQHIKNINSIQDFRLRVETSTLRLAHSMHCPVVLFFFDADTEHGRYLRLDNLEIAAARSRFQSIPLPILNTITTESLMSMMRELASPQTKMKAKRKFTEPVRRTDIRVSTAATLT